jgi:quercetin dioxygenase-like cupin family protein
MSSKGESTVILDKPGGEVNPSIIGARIAPSRRGTDLKSVPTLGASPSRSRCSLDHYPWVLVAGLLALAGCAAMTPIPSSAARVLYIGPQPQRWEEIVRANPLGPNDNIRGVQLLQQPAVSHFLVQIRDREQPHIHREHDATIVMLSGRGRLILKDRILMTREGDVLFIPKGMVHYYVNDGLEPTVVLAIFTPAYDGKDAEVVPFNDRPAGAP